MRGENLQRRIPYLALLFLSIIVLAFVLRLLTFERFLPFTDYADELNMYMLALYWRNAPLAESYGAFRVGDMLGSYPPLFVWLQMGVQSLAETLNNGRWIGAGEMTYYTRLLSLAFGVITTALVLDTGRLMGGWMAGTFAGLVWAAAVPILEFNSLAIPDPLTYLGCAGALWGTVRAFRLGAFRWAFVGLLFGFTAIYAKYVPVYALIPPFAALAWLTYKRARGARLWWSISLAVSVLASAGLIFMVTMRPLNNNEANAARGRGAERMFDISRNWNNFQTMIAPVGAASLLLATGAVVLSYRKRPRHIDPYVVVLLIYLLPVVPLSALVSNAGGRPGPEIRHVMAGSIAVILLWSAVSAWLLRQNRAGRVIAVMGIVVWLIPTGIGDIGLIRRFEPQHIVQQLWTWSDVSLPNDGMILMSPESMIYFTWNRPWSGYDGQTDFQWWLENPAAGSTAQAYVERGITYYAFTDADRARLDSAEFQEFITQLTFIKRLVPASASAGSPVDVYRMLGPSMSLDVHFGEQIDLVGADITVASAAEPIRLRLYWRALQTPDTNYSVFVHVTQPYNTAPVAQADGAPVSLRRPSTLWNDPAELLLSDEMLIPLPSDLPTGDYVLRIGLYDYLTGVRLNTSSGDDALALPISLGAGSMESGSTN